MVPKCVEMCISMGGIDMESLGAARREITAGMDVVREQAVWPPIAAG